MVDAGDLKSLFRKEVSVRARPRAPNPARSCRPPPSARVLAIGTAHEFFLVISDIGLPDGDGYTFVRELREIVEVIRAYGVGSIDWSGSVIEVGSR